MESETSDARTAPDAALKACESALEQSRKETRAAFENRALMYAYFYDELVEGVGADRARELMKRAVYRRGLEIGQKYRAAAEAGDLAEVARIFCEGSPCEGALFEPGVQEEPAATSGSGRTGDRLVLRMTACPLVDAWEAAGYDAGQIDVLCEIAAAVDEGTFEGAGLDFRFLERQPQRGSSRCLLELRVRNAAPPRTNTAR